MLRRNSKIEPTKGGADYEKSSDTYSYYTYSYFIYGM
jgi:hypothetical protein